MQQFKNIWKFATDTFRSLALGDRTTESSGPLQQEFTETNAPLAQATKDRNGVVVVPSSGIDGDEARTKEITDAFSDEIQIVPGPDGRSGIIKPVFKHPEDQEYLYVLVPVEEKVAEN